MNCPVSAVLFDFAGTRFSPHPAGERGISAGLSSNVRFDIRPILRYHGALP